jgi:hypothetical protein
MKPAYYNEPASRYSTGRPCPTTDLFGQALAPASPSAPPASSVAATMSATYGLRSSASSASVALSASLASRLPALLAGRRQLRDSGLSLAGTSGGSEGEGHQRQRVRPDAGDGLDVGGMETAERAGSLGAPWTALEWIACSDGKARPTQPGLFPLAHGVSGRVGRLRAYGNAIVPQVAAAFVRAAA